MMRVLITGGAGFIGSNLAAFFAEEGGEVTVFDNLARAGVVANWNWLGTSYPAVRRIQGDVRDAGALEQVVTGSDLVIHLAAQVAVTTSVQDPRSDFEHNLLGTVNVLEAVRTRCPEARLFYTSTNKVYGGMEDLEVVRRGERYEYSALPQGVSEARCLDFHSPYGCSKGAADQYVRDYHRIYGLRTTVFRMSCIYGPHQCGNEDQGWVAHFIRKALDGEPISIYGDGRQVRDILYVDDLVRAFRLASVADHTVGRIYNIGGGPNNTTSLLELINEIEQSLHTKIDVSFADWRPGDQRVYVTDIAAAEADFAWAPQVTKHDGIVRLIDWLRAQSPIASGARPTSCHV